LKAEKEEADKQASPVKSPSPEQLSSDEKVASVETQEEANVSPPKQLILNENSSDEEEDPANNSVVRQFKDGEEQADTSGFGDLSQLLEGEEGGQCL